MNHLGKENSFSFQRTIHALNKGLKLIIRGGMNMSVIHATEESFAQEIASGLVLVDFYADWCGPCKMIAPVLDELATELEGTAKIVKVNVDNCPAVAAEYKVMSIPTLILFENGEEAQKSIGLISKEELLELINK